MATNKRRGDAVPVAQVGTVQVTGYDVGTTYKLTVGNKVISALAAGGVNQTATALAAAWNASTSPECERITASATTDTVTLTANTAGQAFTVVSSVSGAAGTIGAYTAVTASAGPNHWDTAADWSLAAAPVTTNDVYIENTANLILFGLDAHTVTLTSLNIPMTFVGWIGLPYTNIDDPSNTYIEYLPTYLQIGATTVNIGLGVGSGSGRIKLDTYSIASTINIYNSGSAVEEGLEPILIIGTSITALNVKKGSVGVAVFGGEVSTITTLRMSYVTSVDSDAKVRLGSGVTLTTVQQDGGQLEVNAGFTTLNKTAGVCDLNAGNITTLNLDGGVTYYNGTGTVTTANVRSGATLSLEKDDRACVITNLNLYAGATFKDPYRRASTAGTLTITLVGCSLAEVTLDIGNHIVLARTNGA